MLPFASSSKRFLLRFFLLAALLTVLAACSQNRDTTPPKLSNAGSTSPTTVVVTFSERVSAESAEVAEHYRITASALEGQLATQATLEVLAAELVDGEPNAVVLTTRPQSDIRYTLEVANVQDLAGNQMSPPDRLSGPANVTTFVGTAGDGSPLDTDGDGLSDAAEQRGWIVTVRLVNGQTTQREVTSSPLMADTDEDGVSDRDEKAYGSDPRSGDTDADQLSDAWELNHVYSDPADQDSDGDSLTDGLEYLFFRTSPTLEDTDGDQLLDPDEIDFSNRNPRLADLPLPSIEIGEVDLQLDVRLSATSQRGTRELESKSVASTLTQTESRSFSNTDSNSHEFFFKAGVEVGVEFGFPKNSYEATFSAESGYTGQWTSSFTRESASETQRAYEESLGTEQELQIDESLTREVVGAAMRLGVNVRSIGGIAFNIQNLQVTAFVQDPRTPEKLIPIATLVPESEPAGGFNLGPFVEERGPLVFIADQVFPALVEQLMQDPRGLIFKISNFDVVDEFGRNFAFTSQDINDRTATLVIDYGAADTDGDGEGDTTERLKIATSAGRALDELGAYWFEEPIAPEDLAGYRELRAGLKVNISGGEAEFSRWGWRALLENRGLDIAQPEVCALGGVSEYLRVLALAHAHFTPVINHVWGSAIAVATNLHLLAAMPALPGGLTPWEPMLEFDTTHNAFRDELLTVPLDIQGQVRRGDGYVSGPEGPGLGIEPDPDFIRRYEVTA